MGAAEKVLTVTLADWGQALADLLAPCFTVAGALDAIGRQVEAGEAVAFVADDGGGLVGAFVVRVEGDEGVIVAAAAKGGAGLVRALLPSIEARFIGCRSIRFHTARPGLARIMSGLGYVGQEVVMRKDLK